MSDLLGTIRWRLRQLWLLIRYLPILKCPACKGDGGDTDYWGEYDECRYCYPSWGETRWHGLWWTEGRLSPWRWWRTWLEVKTGQRTATGWLLCHCGLHNWDKIHGGKVCMRCYELKQEIVEDEPANETV
jgi:hypothetical protein